MSGEVKTHDAADAEKNHSSESGIDLDKRVDVSKTTETSGPAHEQFDPDQRAESAKEDVKNESISDEKPVLEPGQKITLTDKSDMNAWSNLDKPYSPDAKKWFDNGGKITVERTDHGQTWTFIDCEGRSVTYIDGYPKFPPEAKNPVIGDISIGEFTGSRDEDRKLYLKKLEEEYGLTAIPDGYDLHHDSVNGNLQLVKTEWHEKFSHEGGHCKFKEDS